MTQTLGNSKAKVANTSATLDDLVDSGRVELTRTSDGKKRFSLSAQGEDEARAIIEAYVSRSLRVVGKVG